MCFKYVLNVWCVCTLNQEQFVLLRRLHILVLLGTHKWHFFEYLSDIYGALSQLALKA